MAILLSLAKFAACDQLYRLAVLFRGGLKPSGSEVPSGPLSPNPTDTSLQLSPPLQFCTKCTTSCSSPAETEVAPCFDPGSLSLPLRSVPLPRAQLSIFPHLPVSRPKGLAPLTSFLSTKKTRPKNSVNTCPRPFGREPRLYRNYLQLGDSLHQTLQSGVSPARALWSDLRTTYLLPVGDFPDQPVKVSVGRQA